MLEETVRHGFKEEVPSYVRQLVRSLLVLLSLDLLPSRLLYFVFYWRLINMQEYLIDGKW